MYATLCGLHDEDSVNLNVNLNTVPDVTDDEVVKLVVPAGAVQFIIGRMTAGP